MIKHWEYKGLQMDFSSMYDDNNHPSDIDLFFMGKDDDGNDILIIGEMKNKAFGHLSDGQRGLLEHFAKRYKDDCIILYITHKESYQNGDRVVDVGHCKVEEYYYSKYDKWFYPKYHTTVKDVIDRYRR